MKVLENNEVKTAFLIHYLLTKDFANFKNANRFRQYNS